MGVANLAQGDFASAAGQFESSLSAREDLSQATQVETLYNLGVSYWNDGRAGDAAAAFYELLGQSGDDIRSETYFYLAQINQALGDVAAALGAYQSYLDLNSDMAAYVAPRIADLYLEQGDIASAVHYLELALTGPALPQTEIANGMKLAELYMGEEAYVAAADLYLALLGLAESDRQRGRMNYLSGYALLLAGDTDAAYSSFVDGIHNFPQSYDSYLGLVELVEAGVPVDQYQRGVVDYHAEMYEPAVVVLADYLSIEGTSARPDAHLYLAWSYEGLGLLESALAQLDLYAAVEPERAQLERAFMIKRLGDPAAAAEQFLAYLDSFPQGDSGPLAAWWAAALIEESGDLASASRQYEFLTEAFPSHEDAPEALYRAGLLSRQLGEGARANDLWLWSAEQYPSSEFGSRSLFELVVSLDESPGTTQAENVSEQVGTATPVPADATSFPPTSGEGSSSTREPNQVGPADPAPGTVTVTLTIAATTVLTATVPTATVPTATVPTATATPTLRETVLRLSSEGQSDSYYAVRSRDILAGRLPFTPSSSFGFPADVDADQEEAEIWLRSWLGLEPGTDIRQISAQLSADQRLIVGRKLWRVGLWQEAKQELEALRRANAADPVATYQLALLFKDLGLYRSSILSAATLLIHAQQTVYEAPPFIGRLLYPVYYADLILPLADQYGFDPRLQFALVRQESLFESFAQSFAAAQGLAQVIPDTGTFIARQLDWPDYENEDLFKPYVGLAFGAYYLDLQLRTFDQQIHVALSAYNGGPGSASRWLETAGGEYDGYLETVDFAETRSYIRRIYLGYAIYNLLYAQ